MAEFQVRYLAEALDKIVKDLVRAGMSEYQPDHSEMIELGSWGIGIIEMLNVKVEYTLEEK